MSKPLLLTGIQPTNRLTLGNYLGAIKEVVKAQSEYDCFLFVADLHSFTVPYSFHSFNQKEVDEFKWNVIKMYIASGIDPNKATIFIQSEIKEHLELFYFLLTHSLLGELKRMTQYKHLSKKFVNPNGTETALVGLLLYPVLMSADILIYDSDYVSIGEDQTQHLELTKDLAERVNERYKQEIFKIPKAFKPIGNKTGLKIRDLQDPTKKMSKSNQNYEGTIFLDDSPEEIKRKIMKAKTDSEGKISLNRETQPGIVNLLEIYSSINNLSIEDAYEVFKNKSYKDLKVATADSVVSELSKIQEAYKSINTDQLQNLLNKSREKCRNKASNKMNLIKNAT